MADLHNSILGVLWGSFGLALVIVTMRLYTRARISKAFGVDDGVTIFSLFINLAANVVVTIAVTKGLGKHMATFASPESAVNAIKWGVISATILDQCLSWPKLPFVIMLHRIFNPNRNTVILLYSSVGILIIACILFTIFNLIWCQPMAKLWNPSLPGTCRPTNHFTNFTISMAAYTALLDLIYAGWAVWSLYHLQMPRDRKIRLSILLGLSPIIAVLAIIRCVLFASLGAYSDIPFEYGRSGLITAVEASVTIAISSLPTTGRFWSFLWEKTYGAGSAPSKVPMWKRDKYHPFPGESKTFGNTAKGADEDEIGLVPMGKDHLNPQNKPIGIGRTTDISVSYEQGRQGQPNSHVTGLGQYGRR